MGEFSVLTAYLPAMRHPAGEWIVDSGHDGSPGSPIQLPWVEYSDEIARFIDDVNSFAIANPQLGLTHYGDILKEAGVSPLDSDVSGLDARTVCAAIVAIVRSERFCDGAVYGAIESGRLRRCLERLAELDGEN